MLPAAMTAGGAVHGGLSPDEGTVHVFGLKSPAFWHRTVVRLREYLLYSVESNRVRCSSWVHASAARHQAPLL